MRRKKTDNVSYLIYVNKIPDPASTLYLDVKERTKYFSEEIPDTVFKGLPAKKSGFSIVRSGICYFQDKQYVSLIME